MNRLRENLERNPLSRFDVKSIVVRFRAIAGAIHRAECIHGLSGCYRVVVAIIDHRRQLIDQHHLAGQRPTSSCKP